MMIEFDDRAAAEIEGLVVQGDLAEESEIEPNPDEGLKEPVQPAMDVEEAFGTCVEEIVQLMEIQLAVVAAGQRPIGVDIVQIEADVADDAPLDACLDDARHADRSADREVGVDFDFIQITGGALNAMVVDEETLEDQLWIGSPAGDELLDAGGVVAEAEAHGDVETRIEDHVERENDRRGLCGN